MPATSRGCKAAASLMRATQNPRLSPLPASIPLTRRSYATATSQLTPSPPSAPLASASSGAYTVQSGIVLSRPPLLTRPLHPFESSFFYYQRRLNERLALPFSRYFYFKKDTPPDLAWKRKAALRNGSPARDLGGYNPYSETGWNDEVLVGAQTGQKATREALVEDAVNRGLSAEEAGAEEEEVVERPLERWTEADVAKDVRRLDRKLTRTLYLVVKNGEGKWQFPAGELVGRENLHQAAERILVQSAGVNMNTWIVGHVPIGHYVAEPYVDAKSGAVARAGAKTFFMKGRIMAGQADLKGNKFGLSDWKWLTREEVEGHVGPKYWSRVKAMIAAR